MQIRTAALAFTVMAAPTWAAVSVYGHGPRLGSAAGGSSSYYPGDYQRHIAEGFTLAQDADLSSVRFWGFAPGSFPVLPGGYKISLWKSDGLSDNGVAGSPGTLLFQQETLVTDARFSSQNEPASNAALTRYDIDLGATVRLNGGERYWISIAGRHEPDMYFDWAWAGSDTSSGYWSGYNIFSSDSWFTLEPRPFATGGQAFELFAIPSPAATSLLAFAAVAVRRRR